MPHLRPRSLPALPALPLLSGATWSNLPDGSNERYRLLLVYRHAHCSVCRSYLRDFDLLLPAFQHLGVNTAAVSGSDRAGAEEAQEAFQLRNLALGYGLDLQWARDLGLFVSSQRKDIEPDWFFEPATLLFGNKGEIVFMSIQSMPFGRTPPGELLAWIKLMTDNQIPPRGEVDPQRLLNSGAS